MEIFKAFVLDGTEYNFNILWENDEPLFRANEIEKVLGFTNIRVTIKSFDNTEKVVRKAYSRGGEQETTFLTECGLYKLLMISRKPAVRPFQKWVADVIKTIRQTGKYELEQLVEKGKEEALRLVAAKHKQEIAMARHTSLLEAFKGRQTVYFGKIRDMEGGKSLIKIGSSDDLKSRVPSLQKEFGSFTLFHIFEVEINRKFERFLQKHELIVCYVYRDEIYEGRRSNSEVFLMTDEETEKALKIAKRNLHKYTMPDQFLQELELRRVKLQTAEARAREQEHMLEIARLANTETGEPERTSSDEEPLIVHERNYTQGRGPKIQRYSPDGKELVQTYPGTAEATRDASLENPSGKGIRDAIKNKSVYKGYRWAGLSRNLHDDTVLEIGESVLLQTPRKGFVAMLSLDRSRVVNVFCDQKAAAEDRQFKGCAAISGAIKNGNQSGGHYFQMWHDVDPELQEAYLATNTLPEKRVAANARAIEQVNPATGAIVKRFASAADITKTIRIARASLNDALAGHHTLKGFLWRFAAD